MEVDAQHLSAGGSSLRASAAATCERGVTTTATPSRAAAAAMSGGTGRPWQRTITSQPTSVQTAIVLRWFWIVTSAQPSPACPMMSDRRSPT